VRRTLDVRQAEERLEQGVVSKTEEARSEIAARVRGVRKKEETRGERAASLFIREQVRGIANPPFAILLIYCPNRKAVTKEMTIAKST
jgi:hypothetical protein